MSVYCSREEVASAMDVNLTDPTRVDAAIATASANVENLCHRRFYPVTESRIIETGERPSVLELDRNEVLAVTSITSDGTAITDYTLRPTDAVVNGRPYTQVDFTGGGSAEDQVTITGTFGFTQDTVTTTVLAENLTSGATTVDVYSGARIGTGEFYKVDDEWVQVTDRGFIDSTVNLAGVLTASQADVLITATGFFVGETLIIGAEQMLVTAVTPTALVVRRAVNGSVLATHAINDDINVLRECTIVRARFGTTAAAHTSGDAFDKLAVPDMVRRLTVAYALDQFAQESAGYARTAGSGDSERTTSTPALKKLERDVMFMFGRSARSGAV